MSVLDSREEAGTSYDRYNLRPRVTAFLGPKDLLDIFIYVTRSKYLQIVLVGLKLSTKMEFKHQPPTTNFLKDSRQGRRLRFGTVQKYDQSRCYGRTFHP